MKRDFRIPLVIFTPKSLLRHPKCTSTLEDFSDGHFMEIIDDAQVNPSEVKQIVCCYGKLYYELLEQRIKLNVTDTAIIRIEQLYPFPAAQLTITIKKYNNAIRWIWAQEEPENMGAWSFVQRIYKDFNFMVVCNPASGSPAVGLVDIHKKRMQKILDKVFTKCTCERAKDYCGMQCEHYGTSEVILKEKKQ
jgi:2-oxoglutarate dehydrogenase E1 component